ncbi:YnhF family membrane protein [Orbus sturtevantii]
MSTNFKLALMAVVGVLIILAIFGVIVATN